MIVGAVVEVHVEQRARRPDDQQAHPAKAHRLRALDSDLNSRIGEWAAKLLTPKNANAARSSTIVRPKWRWVWRSENYSPRCPRPYREHLLGSTARRGGDSRHMPRPRVRASMRSTR